MSPEAAGVVLGCAVTMAAVVVVYVAAKPRLAAIAGRETAAGIVREARRVDPTGALVVWAAPAAELIGGAVRQAVMEALP